MPPQPGLSDSPRLGLEVGVNPATIVLGSHGPTPGLLVADYRAQIVGPASGRNDRLVAGGQVRQLVANAEQLRVRVEYSLILEQLGDTLVGQQALGLTIERLDLVGGPGPQDEATALIWLSLCLRAVDGRAQTLVLGLHASAQGRYVRLRPAVRWRFGPEDADPLHLWSAVARRIGARLHTLPVAHPAWQDDDALIVDGAALALNPVLLAAGSKLHNLESLQLAEIDAGTEALDLRWHKLASTTSAPKKTAETPAATDAVQDQCAIVAEHIRAHRMSETTAAFDRLILLLGGYKLAGSAAFRWYRDQLWWMEPEAGNLLAQRWLNFAPSDPDARKLVITRLARKHLETPSTAGELPQAVARELQRLGIHLETREQDPDAYARIAAWCTEAQEASCALDHGRIRALIQQGHALLGASDGLPAARLDREDCGELVALWGVLATRLDPSTHGAQARLGLAKVLEDVLGAPRMALSILEDGIERAPAVIELRLASLDAQIAAAQPQKALHTSKTILERVEMGPAGRYILIRRSVDVALACGDIAGAQELLHEARDNKAHQRQLDELRAEIDLAATGSNGLLRVLRRIANRYRDGVRLTALALQARVLRDSASGHSAALESFRQAFHEGAREEHLATELLGWPQHCTQSTRHAQFLCELASLAPPARRIALLGRAAEIYANGLHDWCTAELLLSSACATLRDTQDQALRRQTLTGLLEVWTHQATWLLTVEHLRRSIGDGIGDLRDWSDRDADVLIAAAKRLRNHGDEDDAASLLARGAIRAPLPWDDIPWLLRHLERQTHSERARSVIEAQLQRHAHHSEITAQLQLELGKRYESALERPDDAVQAYLAAVLAAPSRSSQAAMRLRVLWHTNGNIRSILDDIEQSAQRHDGHDRAVLLHLLAEGQASVLCEWEMAQATAQRALSTAPPSPELLDTCARLTLCLGDLEAAAAYAEQAATHREATAEQASSFALRAARMHLNQGRLAAAEVLIRGILRRSPNHVGALLTMLDVLEQDNRPTEQAVILDHLLSLDLPAVIHAQARVRRATLRACTGETATGVVEDLLAALRRSPDHRPTHWAALRLAQAHGTWRLAIRVLELELAQSIAGSDFETRIHLDIAAALAQHGRDPEAAANHLRSETAAPDTSTSLERARARLLACWPDASADGHRPPSAAPPTFPSDDELRQEIARLLSARDAAATAEDAVHLGREAARVAWFELRDEQWAQILYAQAMTAAGPLGNELAYQLAGTVIDLAAGANLGRKRLLFASLAYLDPTGLSEAARLGRATLAHHCGRYELALAELSALTQTKDLQLRCRVLACYAEVLGDVGDPAARIFVLRQHIHAAQREAVGQQAELYLALARLQLELAAPDWGLSACQAGLRLAPNHLGLLHANIDCLQHGGDLCALAHAHAQWAAATDQPGQRLTALGRALETILTPRCTDAQLKQAQQWLRAAETLSPADDELNPARLNIAWHQAQWLRVAELGRTMASFARTPMAVRIMIALASAHIGAPAIDLDPIMFNAEQHGQVSRYLLPLLVPMLAQIATSAPSDSLRAVIERAAQIAGGPLTLAAELRKWVPQSSERSGIALAIRHLNPSDIGRPREFMVEQLAAFLAGREPQKLRVDDLTSAGPLLGRILPAGPHTILHAASRLDMFTAHASGPDQAGMHESDADETAESYGDLVRQIGARIGIPELASRLTVCTTSAAVNPVGELVVRQNRWQLLLGRQAGAVPPHMIAYRILHAAVGISTGLAALLRGTRENLRANLRANLGHLARLTGAELGELPLLGCHADTLATGGLGLKPLAVHERRNLRHEVHMWTASDHRLTALADALDAQWRFSTSQVWPDLNSALTLLAYGSGHTDQGHVDAAAVMTSAAARTLLLAWDLA